MLTMLIRLLMAIQKPKLGNVKLCETQVLEIVIAALSLYFCLSLCHCIAITKVMTHWQNDHRKYIVCVVLNIKKWRYCQ